ncbi:hypothetical protein D9M71_720540 [compost metagenome]
MQGEQAYPPRGMDGILMWMVAVNGDFIGNIVKHDDAVEQHQPHEDQQTQGKIIKHDCSGSHMA